VPTIHDPQVPPDPDSADPVWAGPIATEDELDAEARKPSVKLATFAERYPWLGWLLALLVAPFLLFEAWRAARKKRS